VRYIRHFLLITITALSLTTGLVGIMVENASAATRSHATHAGVFDCSSATPQVYQTGGLTLSPDQSVSARTCDGNFVTLSYKDNGSGYNLVLENCDQSSYCINLWSTSLSGGTPGQVSFQANGNFVIHYRDENDQAASYTIGNGAVLILGSGILGNDCNLVLYDMSGHTTWQPITPVCPFEDFG